MKAAAIMLFVAGAAAALADTRSDLAALLADEDTAHEIRALAPFATSLTAQTIPGAYRQAEEGYGCGREKLLEALAGRWIELDPNSALAYARQDEARDHGDIYDAFFSAWSRRDLNGARAALAQMPQGEEQAEGTWDIATYLAGRDPAKAYALTQTVHATRFDDINEAIYWTWARKDLAEATQILIHDSGYGQNRPGSGLTWAVVNSLLDQDPSAAAKWVAALPAGRLHDDAFDHLVDTWARLDPDATLVWLKSLPSLERAQNDIRNISSSGQYSSQGAPKPIKADPSFAPKAEEFAAILDEPFAWRRYQRLIAFVDELAPNEFPLVLDQLRHASTMGREDELDILTAKWTEVDLPEAIAAIPQARAFPDEIFATRVMTDLFSGWSRRDPEAAFAYARRMPQGYGHCEVLETTLRGLARKNPADAYAAFRALADQNSHVLVIPVFEEWAAVDLLAATKAMETEKNYPGAIQGIVQALQRKGLPVAARWAHALKKPEFRDRALEDVAIYTENTEEAMAWLEKEPIFSSKNSAINDVAIDWANRNNVSALRHAAQLPEGTERNSLFLWALVTYTYDDARVAAAWCERLPEGGHKRRSLDVVFETWSERDAPAAAEYLSSHPHDATASTLETVAGAWAQFDPPATARWLNGLSTPASKAAAIAKVAEGWYRGDSRAATLWVNQLPMGVSYDAGAQGICSALGGNLPPALKWARSIRDPRIRHDRVYSAFEAGTRPMRGAYSEAPGIKDEIEGAPELTDADKKKLIAQLPVIEVYRYPQPFKKPSLSPDH